MGILADVMPSGVTREQLLELIDRLTPSDAKQLQAQFAAYERALARESRQNTYLEFVKAMWPAYIHGRHLEIMAGAFERIARGELKRLMIHMPPRHSKSENGSYLFPAWFLGRSPEKKVIQIGHTAEHATGYGRKVRNLVSSPEYRAVFPG